MKFALAIATSIIVCFAAGVSVVLATHGISGSRPAHLAESVAHTSSVPTGVDEAGPAMQNGYDYWNLASLTRPLSSYQNPVAFSAGVKYDLIVDFVAQGGQACVYDFAHCINVNSGGYAFWWRWDDLNVGQVVWNSNQYTSVGNPIIDGQPFRIVAARHELGHDEYLADHDTSYDGLMCHADTCTRRSAATTAELDAASAFFQARSIPANTISSSTTTSSSVGR